MMLFCLPACDYYFRYISETPGASIQFIKADMSVEEDVKRVMDISKAADPPVTRIIHAAGISKDVVLPDLNMEDYYQVASCKARAAYLISELSKDLPLTDFVMISSIAPLIGGKGICAYAAANAYLDGLVRYRRSIGLPAATFNMG